MYTYTYISQSRHYNSTGSLLAWARPRRAALYVYFLGVGVRVNPSKTAPCVYCHSTDAALDLREYKLNIITPFAVRCSGPTRVVYTIYESTQSPL